MDADRTINICEGVPLNSAAAANIFLNTNKDRKINDGTVIHLKTEKPSDVGVHINTTLSIASSKKIKLLFIFNLLLSVICLIISCSVAFYYCNEMTSMRKQIDLVREQLLMQNSKDGVVVQDKPVHSALVARTNPQLRLDSSERQPRANFANEDIAPNARRYYVEDLGEDMLLVDSSKKDSKQDKTPVYNIPAFQKEPLVVHFNGATTEINLGTQAIVGPWMRDEEISSKGSENKIELHTNYFTIQESGLYLIYTQVVYLTHAPNCYFVWARQPAQDPRQLITCGTGDDSSDRPLAKSQISCAAQTLARLYKGDTVNMAQREFNRTLWLRPGYTYFGFIKISS